jgi:epoxyqueuosine reductase
MDQDSATLAEALRGFSLRRGADLFGIADLAPARSAIVFQGGPTVASFPRAISLGMRLSDAVVDDHEPTEAHAESLYWHHVYGVVTPSLDFLANDVARWLAARGHRTLAVPASMPYNVQRLQGIFSHKLGARLAGLGWIGKSSLLLTEQFGPRVRFATVLTDAPLETGAPLDRGCGTCRACVDACPVGAFTGAEFNAAEDLAVRFNAPSCKDYRKSHACGVCVASCPKGMARARRKQTAPRD